MSNRLPHVTWLRAFEAAARHGSFSSAADELHLTPAAVSQQIRLLEQKIGVTLFRRLPRGVALTDQGQAYAQPIRKAFLEMQNATEGLFDVKRRKSLHVRASISFGTLELAPRLHKFRALHPEIELQLSTTVWSDRMDDSSVDFDIRWGNGDWAESDIHRLGREEAVLACNPEYAVQVNEDIHKASQQDVVLIVGSEVEWARLSEYFELGLSPVQNITRADSTLVALHMLCGGPGMALISDRFLKPYLETGQLVCPFAYRLPIRESYYLVTQSDSNERKELALFRDWMISEFCNPAVSEEPPQDQ